jgi:hypothetical protein
MIAYGVFVDIYVFIYTKILRKSPETLMTNKLSKKIIENIVKIYPSHKNPKQKKVVETEHKNMIP